MAPVKARVRQPDGLRDANRVNEVGGRQILGTDKARPGNVGLRPVGMPEVGTVELGFGEDGLNEVGALEVRVREVCARARETVLARW